MFVLKNLLSSIEPVVSIIHQVAGLPHSASSVKAMLAMIDFNKNNGVELRELLSFINDNTVRHSRQHVTYLLAQHPSGGTGTKFDIFTLFTCLTILDNIYCHLKNQIFCHPTYMLAYAFKFNRLTVLRLWESYPGRLRASPCHPWFILWGGGMFWSRSWR